VSQTSGAPRRLWDAKAPPTSALRDYGLASQARETDGDGLRLVAYASESAPIFTPEFPKADPYLFERKLEGHIVTCFSDKYSSQSWNRFCFKKEMVLLKESCADCFRHMRFGGCSPFSGGSQQQDFELFADRWN
jgi:hypothetical protein